MIGQQGTLGGVSQMALKHPTYRGVRTRDTDTLTGRLITCSSRQAHRWLAAETAARLVAVFFFFLDRRFTTCSLFVQSARDHTKSLGPRRPSNLLTKQDSNYGGR